MVSAGRTVVGAGRTVVDAGRTVVGAGRTVVGAGRTVVDAGRTVVGAGCIPFLYADGGTAVPPSAYTPFSARFTRQGRRSLATIVTAGPVWSMPLSLAMSIQRIRRRSRLNGCHQRPSLAVPCRRSA